MGYIPTTPKEKQQMLDRMGLANENELYIDIPADIQLEKTIPIEPLANEYQLMRHVHTLADKNTEYGDVFMGAGAYKHLIPAAVDALSSRGEFVTTYTPYQAEMNQGVLQSIFEFQTMICELTGMDVSNASVYDGATAAAEACLMVQGRKQDKVLVSATADPQTIDTIRTYLLPAGMDVILLPEVDGKTNAKSVQQHLDECVAGVYLDSPNFYGLIEDIEDISTALKNSKAKLIVGVNPIAAALLKTPAQQGADIAVGEGQPLGLPLAFGGPYLGFMACKQKLMRQLPGRIVGKTTDDRGRRAFVLTLQAREQHIRRGKASSNICSNQAWCALRASMYLSLMGKEGLCDVAKHCYANAHYLQEQLESIGFSRVHNSTFFHEFVTHSPVSPDRLQRALDEKNILGGLPLDNQHILWCATELNDKKSIDRLISLVKEVEND